MEGLIRVPKDWGEEVWITNTPLYCGKKLLLKKGRQCSLHHHRTKDETFHLLSGRVQFELDCVVWTLIPGETVHVPAYARHRFGGIEDSVILEISTFHSDADVYRDEPSRSMNV